MEHPALLQVQLMLCQIFHLASVWLTLHFLLQSAQAPSAERLGQQSTEDYSDDDPWRITAEQLEYYTNQFKSLQPDLGALILGMETPKPIFMTEYQTIKLFLTLLAASRSCGEKLLY